MHPVLIPLAIAPRDHIHEIRHKRGNRTLQDGGISTDDVLVIDLGLVELLDHWKNHGKLWFATKTVITVGRSREKILLLVRVPGDDANEIRNKGRYLTL